MLEGSAPGPTLRLLRFVAVALAAALAHGCARAEAPRGPLRIVVGSSPLSLDPHLQNEAVTRSILSNVYDALVEFGPEMDIVPSLAERWESPDDVTWRFSLREAYFHDGRRLTADDVVFSIERAWHHPRSKLAGYLDALKDVSALDPRTVVVHTTRPWPNLLNKLTVVEVVPSGAPEEVQRPIGTGPYRFISQRAGQDVTLAAFDRHWRGAPAEPDVRFLVVPDEAAQVDRLLTGQADVVPGVAWEQAPRVENAACCRVRWTPGLAVSDLGMRVDREPFSDARLRRAVSLALDREALVRTARRGHGHPSGQLVTRSVFGYAPEIAAPGRDVAAARELLASAGRSAGLDVELEYPSVSTEDVRPIAAQLAEAGIRVRLQPRAWEELYARLMAGAPDFFLVGLVSNTGDASDIFDNGLRARDVARGYGTHNFTGYASRRLEALLDRSSETRRAKDRLVLLREAMAVAVEDLPLVPLWSGEIPNAMRAEVEWQPRHDLQVRAASMRRR